jgi:zinc protease
MTFIHTARGAIAGLLLLVAACLPAGAMEVREVTSPGGIKAWLVSSDTVPLIAMSFSFEGGATLDPKGKEGVAHYITGMMDEGAADMDALAFQTARDDIGMKLSFDSGLDRIEASFQTPSAYKDQAYALLNKTLTSPRFETDAMERMRQQFLVSAQQRADDPNEIASEAIRQLAFGTHPYGRSTKGTAETIAAITADDLRAFHKAVFTRKGLKIGVVGDITAEDLGLVLDKIFGALPDTAPPGQPAEVQVAEGPAIRVIERDIPQSIVAFMARGIKRDDPAFFPAFVMSHILGGGDFGTRLTAEVREKRGLTYGIGYGLQPLKSAGAYTGSFSTRNEKAGEALDVVRETLRRMAKEGPSQQELDDAKTFLTGSYALRFDSNAKIADQLLGQQQVGMPSDYFKTRNARIEAVTLDQVKEQARRLLDADKLLTVVVGKPEGVKSTVN